MSRRIITKILLVEDNPGDARLVEVMLAESAAEEFHVTRAVTLAQAQQVLAVGGFAVVLLDLSLPDSQGLDSVKEMVKAAPGLPIIVLTGNLDEAFALEALKQGAEDYLVKGLFDPPLLVRALRYAQERKRAEEALLASEARFRDFTEIGSDWYWETGPDLRYTYISERYSEHARVSRDAVIGRSRAELLAEYGDEADLQSRTWTRHEEVIARRQPYRNLLVTWHRPDGETRIFALNGKPVFERDGRFLGYRGTGSDITEIKERERQLEESEARFRALVELSPDAIIVHREAVICYCNPSAVDLMGAGSAEELLGRNLLEMIHPDYRARSAERLRALLAGSGPLPLIESRMCRLDGTTVDVEARAGRTTFMGKPALQSILRDITERNKAEDEIRALHRRNALILQSAGEGIFGTDRNGKITFVNRAALRMTGFRHDEVVGQDAHGLFFHTARDGSPVPRQDWSVLATARDGVPREAREEVMWRKDHSFFPVAYVITPIEDKGEVTGIVVVVRDITVHKQAQDALRLSEARARAAERRLGDAIESISEGFALWDEDGRLILCNGKYREIHGPIADALVAGARLEDVIDAGLARGMYLDAAGREEEWKAWRLAESRKPATQFEQAMADGRWLLASERRTDQGFTVGVRTDITELRQREQALRDGEARKAAVLATALDGVVTMDLNGRVVDFNPAAEKTFGYSRAEAVGRPVADLIVPPDLREAHVLGLERYLKTGVGRVLGRHVEVEAMRADATTFPAELSVAETQIAGQPFFTAYIRDITERKAAESALRESEEKYRTIINLTSEGYWLLDGDGIIREVNDALCRMLGVDAGDLIGRGAVSFAANEESRQTLSRGVASGGGAAQETHDLMLAAGDGREIHAKVNATALRHPRRPDAMVGSFAFLTDITERIHAERQLRITFEDLRRSNAELEQFASVVSHDIKAPLRAIHNYSDFLSEDLAGTLEEEQQEYLDGLVRAVNEAQELVEDLLAFSRIGRKEAPAESVDLGRLIDAVATSLHIAEEAELVLGEDWPTIHTSPLLLRQILQNLMSNAAKFNRAETKRIEVTSRPHDADCIEISVSDNGIGIEPQYRDQIFGIFHRLHTRDEYDGTGVGLAIVRKAAAELGGRVEVDSVPGEGSTFTVILPRHWEGRVHG